MCLVSGEMGRRNLGGRVGRLEVGSGIAGCSIGLESEGIVSVNSEWSLQYACFMVVMACVCSWAWATVVRKWSKQDFTGWNVGV